MTKKIIIPIFGGLGNQMFQVAHAVSLKQKFQVTPCYVDLTQTSGRIKRNWSLDCFGVYSESISELEINKIKLKILISRILKKNKIKLNIGVIEEGDNYEQITESFSTKVCTGYWQGIEYFDDSTKLIKRLFTFPSLNPKLLSDYSYEGFCKVAVHVRRGDYISDPIAHSNHFVCSEEWYMNAIKEVRKKINNPKFLIFTDDQKWANEIFGKEIDVSIVNTDKNFPPWIDMALMSRCKHFIISNSSYSWWAAFLGKSYGSIVIAPAFWFPNIPTNSLKIYCEDWQLL